MLKSKINYFEYERRAFCLAFVFSVATFGCSPCFLAAQDKSVRPGINASFEKPTPSEFMEKFEVESREIFAKRNEIVSASKIEPEVTIADVGAGTGLFTRLFAKATGPKGKVIAVDIAPNFLDHIASTCKAEKLDNVSFQLCNQESCLLPPNSVDIVFVCDTYHHFEFPAKTMASISKALKPKGKLVLIDLHRIEGVSTEWAMKHVRASMETVEKEIRDSGFEQADAPEIGLKENYFIVYRKATP
jgi:SAM-dependent methyltransferase